MGVAALWVMLFHGTMNIPIHAVDVFIKIGYLGVDIFMFMSGFSMSNSLGKSGGAKGFYIRRLKKILPTFVPFAILWYASYLSTEYGSTSAIMDAAHTSEFWIILIIFRWFVPAILFCYLITPVIDLIFQKFVSETLAEIVMVLIGVMVAIPFAFIGSSVALMIFTRVPEYVIGYRYGLLLKSDYKKPFVFIRVILIIVLYIIYYYLLSNFTDIYLGDTGLYWWPAIFGVSSIVVCLSRCRWIDNTIFNFMGKYSLELYLWHVWVLFPLQSFWLKRNLPVDDFGIIINILGIIIACVVAWVYAKSIIVIIRKIRKENHEN